MDEDIKCVFDEIVSSLRYISDVVDSFSEPLRQTVMTFIGECQEHIDKFDKIWNITSEEERRHIRMQFEEIVDEISRLKEQMQVNTTKPSKH